MVHSTETLEDKIAKEEYGMDFIDLPGNIKQLIHNQALSQLGMRQAFKFKCINCGELFEEIIEGSMVEAYLDIISTSDNDILESLCPSCRHRKEEAEYETKN